MGSILCEVHEIWVQVLDMFRLNDKLGMTMIKDKVQADAEQSQNVQWTIVLID